MIVVLDSGVWISALHFGGAPRLALEGAFDNHDVAICNGIVGEVDRILVAKFAWTHRQVELALEDYLAVALSVPVDGTLHETCRDPKDDMVFECAVNAKAQFIISGDKDLLAVGCYENSRVITVREYLNHFGRASISS